MALIAFFAILSNWQVTRIVSVNSNVIDNTELSACSVFYSYDVLGAGRSLNPSMFAEIQDRCAADNPKVKVYPEWKSEPPRALTPSYHPAFALAEKKFTARQWATSLSSSHYNIEQVLAPDSRLFNFWEFDTLYWETHAKQVKGVPSLLVNVQHRKIVAERADMMEYGKRRVWSRFYMP